MSYETPSTPPLPIPDSPLPHLILSNTANGKGKKEAPKLPVQAPCLGLCASTYLLLFFASLITNLFYNLPPNFPSLHPLLFHLVCWLDSTHHTHSRSSRNRRPNCSTGIFSHRSASLDPVQDAASICLFYSADHVPQCTIWPYYGIPRPKRSASLGLLAFSLPRRVFQAAHPWAS